MNDQEDIKKYRKYLRRRLDSISHVFAKAAVGDFSGRVQIPDEEDELTEFFVGVKILLDSINEKVTALKDSVQELETAQGIIAKEKARLDAILHSIQDGLVTTDEFGHVKFVNNQAAAILGSQAEILGQDVAQVIKLERENGEHLHPDEHPLYQAIEHKQKIIINLTKGESTYVRRENQERRRVSLSINPIKQGNKVTGVVAIVRDITEEANLDRAKSEIISIASHQLRTPLTAIKWHTEALMSGSKLDEKKRQHYLSQIHDSNEYMVKLVDSLLNVSRIELGTFRIHPEPLDLVEIIEKALQGLENQIYIKEIKVSKIFKFKDDLIADANTVAIVVQNLLSNAVKYSKHRGRVRVCVEKYENGVLLEVGDNGFGIPEHEQNRIFSKLFRATNAAQISTEGSGLGLYVAKEMIERSGGKLWFESKEGSGTSFYATIPNRAL